MNQPNFFAIIPATVRYNENLSGDAKLLYGEITAMCNKEGYCWATNQYFQELYNKSERTISRHISSLCREGFLNVEIDKIKGNKRRIYLTTNLSIPIDKNVYTLTTKMSIPIDKNGVSYKENNTINNTSEYIEKTGFEFLQEYHLEKLEVFLMKYKSQIDDFDAFVKYFNNQVDEKELKYNYRVLSGRLKNLANNWIVNQQKNKQQTSETKQPWRNDCE